MLIRISDDNKLILESIISENYAKGFCDSYPLSISLIDGHLFVVPNNGGTLKVKRYKRILGKLIKVNRKEAMKRKPVEFEGFCIDLNYKEDPNIKKKE